VTGGDARFGSGAAGGTPRTGGITGSQTTGSQTTGSETTGSEAPGPSEAPRLRAHEAYTLREMRWWDIEPVLGLEHALFPEDAWSRQMFWGELAHARGPGATRRYLVAETGGAYGPESLAGYGGLAAVAGTGDIQTIGVLPAHQRAGLGARLLAALLSAAAADFRCHEALLEVRVDNARAQRLYERFGFAPIGVRRGYYQPGNVDALVMRLDGLDRPELRERLGRLARTDRHGPAGEPGPHHPPDRFDHPGTAEHSGTADHPRNAQTHGHGTHGNHGIHD